MTDAPSQSLYLVSNELASTLDDARHSLEDYAEGNAGRESLAKCSELIHLVRGALRIVEVYGAALLAEEMEYTLDHLLQSNSGQVNEDGVEALSRSMVQLPAYLDQLQTGGRDIALVLLPLLNDLRAVRGKPLLSEGTLLLLNIAPDRDAGPKAPTGIVNQELSAAAAKLRPSFQVALLGWIRNERPEHNLAKLHTISRALEGSTSVDVAYQLWYVVSGLLEAVTVGGLEASVAIKRLLGQVDRQLKLLIDGGEAAFVNSPPVDLMNNLLFYVARTTKTTDRITAIRSSFGLNDLLPGESDLQQVRDGLAGPSVKLMRTVAVAIKEDLGSVKDALDIFVRTGMASVDELRPQLDLLKKIGDTLGVLGLGELRDRIQSQVGELNTIIAADNVHDEQTLLDMASTLLDVEDNLDQQLVRVAMSGGALEEPSPQASEYQHVTEAVVRECIVNLAHVKDAVTDLVNETSDSRAIDQLGPELKGIVAGLTLLERDRAAQVAERLGKIIATHLTGGQQPLKVRQLDRLADAMVSLEYYLETISAGRSDPWYMLDNAESCLDFLDQSLADLVPAEAPAVAEEPAPKPQIAKPPIERPPVMEQAEDYADPELVELFIEESKEELQSIKRYFPQWREAQSDSQALITVRRSFHTLKGSGRMVGAKLLGEFAWSVENLLNRIINQTLVVNEPMLEFLEECIAVLPQLIEQLEIGTQPRSDIHLLMKQAEAFAEGDPDATRLTSESLRVPKLEVPEEVPPSHEMDPVLKEIFVKEARGHLAAARAFIDANADQLAPHRVTEEMYRACHTLSGSARMAGVQPAVALATPLEKSLNAFQEERKGLDNQQFALVTEAVGALEQYVNDVDAEVTPQEDHHDLIERLNTLLPAADSAEPAEEQLDDADFEPEQTLADIDPEIAAMFTEEATELLDDAERALTGLRGGETVSTQVGELQRLLHTLKGGARMAGFSTMGNLSHGLEALLERWSERSLEPAEADIEVLQATLDELHRMRDAAQDGRELPEATGLLERIDAVIRGEQSTAPMDTDDFVEEQPDRTSVLPALDIPESEREPAMPEEPLEDAAEATGVLKVAFTDLRESADEFGTSSVVIDDDEDLMTHAAEALADEPPAEPDVEAEGQAEAERLLSEAERLEDEAGEDRGGDEPREAEEELSPEVPAVVMAEEAAMPAGEDADEGIPRPLRSPLEREEVARVNAELLDSLLNSAGEISIFQSRLNQQTRAFEFHLTELSQTVMRLREQLRKLEMETEAQILYRHQQEGADDENFDPLELDRYSTIQQLSRALAESVSDVASINDLLRNHNNDADTLLTQQGRVTAELQDGLMRTRMVPFQRHVSRLARIVRQAAKDTGKPAELTVIGGGELDRQVLERMLGPLEHLLRNAVVHGIEPVAERRLHNKPATGQITLSVQREGSEVIIEVADDGAGLNLTAIRQKAIEQKLISADVPTSDEDAMELILQPGFSTARELTQTAGRGVGMDVVDNEVKTLGGSLRIHSERGRGTRFVVRLPYTLAITQALIVNVAEESFALPLPTVEGITRVPKDQLLELLTEDDPRLTYADHSYRIQHLGMFVGAGPSALPEEEAAVPLILIRAGNSSTALLTDELEGSKEIVVKTLGPQVTSITGVSGATILGDGRIVVILDAGSLVRAQRSQGPVEAPQQPAVAPHEPTALVVDDSITVRRVTQRLLERHGMRVITAKDGLDAIAKLQEVEPDIILLDIEMPRMDGYQFASHVRNDPEVKDVPIVMITSRSSEKHRARAIELGVNDYLSKPYQERELVASIEPLIGRSL